MFFFFIFKKKSREIVLAYYFKITVKPFFIGLALDVKIIFKKHFHRECHLLDLINVSKYTYLGILYLCLTDSTVLN